MLFWQRCLIVALVLSALGLSGGCQQRPLADDLALAREAIHMRDWNLAEKHLQRYLRTTTDPKRRWEAWKELLDVADYGNLGNDGIVDCLETMLVEYEGDSERTKKILRRLGMTHDNARRPERAVTFWSALLEEPNLDLEESVWVHRRLAADYFHLRQFELAEDVLQDCISLPIEEALQAECMLDQADYLSAREMLDDSERLAVQILDMGSASPDIRGRAGYLVGDIQEQRGRFKDAYETFLSVRHLYPNELVIENRLESLKSRVKR